MSDDILKAIDKLTMCIDKLGFNNYQPAGQPGTTEKIAIELADMNKTLDRIADFLEVIASQNEE